MGNLLINPYKVGPPVMGTDFYGRSELLSKVQKALQTSNVVLLQGQRRIGKTSFLKQLSVFLKSPEGMQAFQMPLVPVIFDIQRYVQDTLPQFQWHLAEAIARELQLTVPSLPEWEANHVLFRDVWLPRVYERLGDRGLVILVDEFDNLEGQAVPQAMQTLIPFLGQLVSGETRLKWVLTLGRQTGKLPIQYDPIVSSGVSFRMSFLSLEETLKLIEAPAHKLLTYQPEAIERIYQLTSGQPHLTQALGSEIFQRVVLEEEREIVEAADVDAIVTHVLETYSGAIASIVKVPPIEERVLAAVARLTEANNYAKREKITGLLLGSEVRVGIDELVATLRSLIKWELLKGNKGRVRISVELIRIWLAENLSVEPTQENSLDIQYELAQSRFEFAEKARQAGKLDLAIEDYQEALEQIPNYTEALRGLAEAYRSKNNLAEQVKVIEILYSYERNTFNELIEALESYASRLEEDGKIATALHQYEKLLKMQGSAKCQQKITQLLSDLAKSLESYLELTLKAVETAELSLLLDAKSTKTLVSLESEEYKRIKSYQTNIIRLDKEANSILTSSIIPETNHLRDVLENNKSKQQKLFSQICLLDAIYEGNWGKATNILFSFEKSAVKVDNYEEKLKLIINKYFDNRIMELMGFLIVPLFFIILFRTGNFIESFCLTFVMLCIGALIFIGMVSFFIKAAMAEEETLLKSVARSLIKD